MSAKRLLMSAERALRALDRYEQLLTDEGSAATEAMRARERERLLDRARNELADLVDDLREVAA